MTTPTVRLLFLVFVGKRIFKRAAMQVQGHDITGGKGVLRQGRVEQFVDDSITRHSHSTLLAYRCPMGGNHNPAWLLLRTQSQVWTIVERSYDPALRMGEVLIGRQVQTGLHLRMLEQVIVFAAHDAGQSCKIREDDPIAVLAIQPHEGTLFGVLVRLEVASNDRHCPA
jgi:hypothetical protein